MSARGRLPFRLIGILLLGYVLYVVDLKEVGAQLRRIDAVSLSEAVLAFICLTLLRCWRWHVLVRSSGTTTSVRASFAACNTSIWMGLASPGRLGEFSRAMHLTQTSGKSLVETSALVTFDLLLDLFASVAMAAAGLVLLALQKAHQPAAFPIYLGCVLAGLVCLTASGPLLQTGRRILLRTGTLPQIAALAGVLVTNLDRKTSWQIAVATVGAYTSYTLMIASLIAPMQLALDTSSTFTTVALAGVAGAVPITYFGLGTRDFALVWFFDQLGFGSAPAVAVSFSFLLAQVIGILVSLSLAALFRIFGPRGSDA